MLSAGVREDRAAAPLFTSKRSTARSTTVFSGDSFEGVIFFGEGILVRPSAKITTLTSGRSRPRYERLKSFVRPVKTRMSATILPTRRNGGDPVGSLP